MQNIFTRIIKRAIGMESGEGLGHKDGCYPPKKSVQKQSNWNGKKEDGGRQKFRFPCTKI